MKKFQSLLLTVFWFFLASVVGRTMYDLATSQVETIEQAIVMSGLVLFVGLLMYVCLILIKELLKEAFNLNQ